MSTGHSGVASGGQLEEVVDFTKETDETLQTAETLVNESKLEEALVLMEKLEKKTRTNNDNPNLVRVCEAVVKLCKDQPILLEVLQTYSTKRSQKVAAISALVKTCLPWVIDDYEPIETNNNGFRDELIHKLRDVTDGKLFLERERAQLTRALSTIYFSKGDTAQAAKILQDVHVETYGSLSKKEKIQYILLQLKLNLLNQDYVRAAIVSRKIQIKHLNEYDELKIQYYELLQVLHRNEKNALELVKDYLSIYQTNKELTSLQDTVLFVLLTMYGNEQQDILHKISLDANLEKIPVYKSVIDLLLTKELIPYPMPHQSELEQLPSFQENNMASYWQEIMKQRILQHNIRIISIYYSKIHCSKLSARLQLDTHTLEGEIANLVNSGSLYAKMDRPNDLIYFQKPVSPEAKLSAWASDIDKLLHLVETTTHLIHKEQEM